MLLLRPGRAFLDLISILRKVRWPYLPHSTTLCLAHCRSQHVENNATCLFVKYQSRNNERNENSQQHLASHKSFFNVDMFFMAVLLLALLGFNHANAEVRDSKTRISSHWS